MAEADFRFDQRAGRWRDITSGRWVPERDVRRFVDNLADQASRRMANLAAQYRSGEITASAWMQGQLAEIKAIQISSALVAYGGRSEMSFARWGTVGQLIRREYAFARQMVADALDGRQRLNGRLDARSAMYGQSGRTSYENLRRREEATRGLRYEQNHLHAAESCAQCRAQSSLGSVPIGTLVPVGSRTCRAACRCTITYSTRQEVGAA